MRSNIHSGIFLQAFYTYSYVRQYTVKGLSTHSFTLGTETLLHTADIPVSPVESNLVFSDDTVLLSVSFDLATTVQVT